jgi:hypothetical protein
LGARLQDALPIFKEMIRQGHPLAAFMDLAHGQVSDTLDRGPFDPLSYHATYKTMEGKRNALEAELGFKGERINAVNSAHAIAITIRQYAQMEALEPSAQDFQEYLITMGALPSGADTDKFAELMALDGLLCGMSLWNDRIETLMKN